MSTRQRSVTMVHDRRVMRLHRLNGNNQSLVNLKGAERVGDCSKNVGFFR